MSPVLSTIVLIFSVLLSGCLVFLFSVKDEKGIKLLLAFSGAYILALCLFHLIPEVYQELHNVSYAGWAIIVGFMLQLALDYISGGIEHGHIHFHKHNSENPADHHHPVVHQFPQVMLIGLCIHAFIEGIPLFIKENGNDLLLGIVLHNIPISITLMVLLQHAGKSLLKSLSALLVFALMSPAGAWLALYLPSVSNNEGESMLAPLSLAMVIGIFLHISTTILFESDKNHRFNLVKFLTILTGVAACYFLNQH